MLSNFQNLRTQCMVIGGLLIFLAMGILGITSYHFANIYLQESETDSVRLLSENAELKVNARLAELIGYLEATADTARLKNANDETAILSTLTDCMARAKEFSVVAYVDLKGNAIRQNGVRSSVAEREYFKKVMQTGKSYVSEVLISSTTQKPAVILAVPVMTNGKMSGIVYGSYELSNLQGIAQDIKFAKTGFAYLVDQAGTIIVHSKNQDLVQQVNLNGDANTANVKNPSPIDPKLTQLYKASLETADLVSGVYTFGSDELKFSTFSTINLPGGNKWTLGITAPESEVNESINTLLRNTIIITIVCIIIAMLAVMYLSTKLITPIIEIRNQLTKLAAGNLALPELSINSKNELGELVAACNKMVRDLKSLLQ